MKSAFLCSRSGSGGMQRNSFSTLMEGRHSKELVSETEVFQGSKDTMEMHQLSVIIIVIIIFPWL